MTRTSLLCCSLFVAACAAGPESEDRELPAEGGELIERTIVRVGDDGRPIVSQDRITRAHFESLKRHREAAVRMSQGQAWPDDIARIQQPLVATDACGPAMWLFDQPNLGGRQLCLVRSASGLDAAALSSFVRFFEPRDPHPRTWAGAVRSFWAGDDPGYFRVGNHPYVSEAFTTLQRRDSVSTTVFNAVVMALHPNGNRPSAELTGIFFPTHGSSEFACPKPTVTATATNLRTGATSTVNLNFAFFLPGPARCHYRTSSPGLEWGEVTRYTSSFFGGKTCFWLRSDVGEMQGTTNPPTLHSSTDTRMEMNTCDLR